MSSHKFLRKKAFTIVELLVVIVVIGILAALVIIAYTNFNDRAKIASLQSDLTNNSATLKLYYGIYGSYPTSLNGTCPLLPSANSDYCLKFTPGNAYNYNGSSSSFQLSASSGSFTYIITETTTAVAANNGDGSSAVLAATSGYALKQNYPSKPSGYYWIKSTSMPNPLQMYVDMTLDGGGYDYYVITSGTPISYSTNSHSGTSLGLDLVYPRSQNHWKSMYNFVSTVLGGSLSSYFQTTYKITASTKSASVPSGTWAAPNLNGNYATYIMRDPTYYGSGAPDFKVPDNGRWWLRDTTFGEPNGDYFANGFLGLYAAGGVLNSDGSLSGFNDAGTYSTGTTYLVSTNAKP